MRRWKRHGDEASFHRILEAHMRFVVAIALGYRIAPVAMDDIISEGSVGLIMALDKYDPSRGTRFVTYASFWIRACILDLVIRSCHSGKRGSGPFNSKIFFKLRRERARLHARFGDGSAGRRVLASSMGMRRDVLDSMLDQLDAVDVSVDQPAHADGTVTLKDMIPDLRPGPEEEATTNQIQGLLGRRISEALSELEPRERFIIETRILGAEPRTLADVGREMGVSRERARQLEGRACRKLRKLLGDSRDGIMVAA